MAGIWAMRRLLSGEGRVGLAARARTRAATRRRAVLLPLLLLVAPALLAGCGGRHDEGRASGGVGAGKQPAWDAARAPNVVIYLVDTLRRDHLGAYGYARPTSPAFDRVAAEGGLLRDYRVPTVWTKPSVASLFTGLHPILHGCQDREDRLWPGWLTLPEAFDQAGYATIAVVANPFVHPDLGFAQGFGAFRDASDLTTRTGTSSENVNQMFLEELDALAAAGGARRPFFAYLHTMDPHAPYTPRRRYLEAFLAGGDGHVLPRGGLAGATPEEAARRRNTLTTLRTPAEGQPYAVVDTRREQKRRLLQLGIMKEKPPQKPTPEYISGMIDLYDAEVRQNDDQLGELVGALQARGLWDNTLLVVVSDHGEGFFEHQTFGHGNTLYRELTRVPCAMHWPSGETGEPWRAWCAAARERRVTTMELASAITELTGVEARAPLAANAGWAAAAVGADAPAALANVGALILYDCRWLSWEQDAWRGVYEYLPERAGRLYEWARDPAEAAPLDDPARTAAATAALTQALARGAPGLLLAARHAAPGDTLHVTAPAAVRDWLPLDWEDEGRIVYDPRTGALRLDLVADAAGDVDGVIIVPREGREGDCVVSLRRTGGAGPGAAGRVSPLAMPVLASPPGRAGGGAAKAPRVEWAVAGGPWDPTRPGRLAAMGLAAEPDGAGWRLRIVPADSAPAASARGEAAGWQPEGSADARVRQLCAALGLPVPAPGNVAAGWRTSPVRWASGEARPLTPEAAARLEQQLKALGYVH